jgi:hypothetical protein
VSEEDDAEGESGVVDTATTHRIAAARTAENGISVDEAIHAVLDRVPLGRMETADDVADVIGFLLSDPLPR